MKTRDEMIRDLAHDAMSQCEALYDKMCAVVEGRDDLGCPDPERICGIARDKDGCSMLVFAEPFVTNARTVVYVDDILALAKLLNGEVQVDHDPL